MVSIHDDALELVSPRHDEWRETYLTEHDRLRRALAERDLYDRVHRIEHVGSTAIPGLAAKDIVDVDLVVADGVVADVASAVVDELGGTRVTNSAEWHPVFREVAGQRVNVHVFARSGDGWKTSVATRDVLRAHDDLRAEYESLKRRLAAETDDVERYSDGKSEFIARVPSRARDDDELAFEFSVPA